MGKSSTNDFRMRAAKVAIDFGRDDRFDGGIKLVLHMARIVSWRCR